MSEIGRLHNPRIGQTLRKLLLPPRIFTPEDYAFGNQAVMERLSYRPISESIVNRLAGLSVQTQEGLFGYLKTPGLPDQDIAGLLDMPVESLPRLREFLAETLNRDTMSDFAEVSREEYAFGAVPSPAEPGEETEAPQDDGIIITVPCAPPIKDQGRRGTCVAHSACASGTASSMTASQTRMPLDLKSPFPLSLRTAFAMNPSGSMTPLPSLVTSLMIRPGRHHVSTRGRQTYPVHCSTRSLQHSI
jgi:hypothetical protein